MVTKKESTDLSESQVKLLLDKGATLSEIFETFGVKLVAAKAAARGSSRIARQEQWLIQPQRKLEGDEKKNIQSLSKVVGSAVLPDEPRDLSQAEVDAAMAEALVIRPAQDTLEGRYKAVRQAVFNAMDERFGELTDGTIVSLPNGHKFVRLIKQGSPYPDYAALEERLDPEVWKSITDRVTVRTVNEDKLMKALDEGLVTDADVEAILVPPKPSAAFYVKPLKPGDEVLARVTNDKKVKTK